MATDQRPAVGSASYPAAVEVVNIALLLFMTLGHCPGNMKFGMKYMAKCGVGMIYKMWFAPLSAVSRL